jgi:hypothetical protein
MVVPNLEIFKVSSSPSNSFIKRHYVILGAVNHQTLYKILSTLAFMALILISEFAIACIASMQHLCLNEPLTN